MNAKHTVLLEFADPDDANRVCRCVGYAKKSDGTLPPLQCGLLTQALKRSEVRIDHAPELAEALRLCWHELDEAAIVLADVGQEQAAQNCAQRAMEARAVLAKLEGGGE